jgi:SpoVK/Ycf46/Vps4 family AAA+-type ATPase
MTLLIPRLNQKHAPVNIDIVRKVGAAWSTSFIPRDKCERTQYRNARVILLSATNNTDQVDPEVLDCFQERMAVKLPNRDARIKLFTRSLTHKKIDFSLDDGAHLLAELTEGKSLDSRDLENSVQAAQQKALLRAVRNGGPEHYSIMLDDFELLHTK